MAARRKITRKPKSKGANTDVNVVESGLQSVVPAEMPRGLSRPAQKKWRMLVALEKHLGVVMHACKEAQVSRRTHYYWMEHDPEYREKVEDVEENAFDFVEHKLYESVQDKNIAAIIFFAKTRMKKRGYIERQEITGADGGPIQGKLDMNVVRGELPPKEVLEVMRQALGEDKEVQNAIKRIQKEDG